MADGGDAVYDFGYFEGVRNVFMAYIRSGGDEESFLEWVKSELESAKGLRDRWDEDGY